MNDPILFPPKRTPTPDDPFSETAIAQAEVPVENLPDNQVQVGITDTQTDGLGVEAEGKKELGTSGWYIAGDATFTQRLGLGVAAILGWKSK